MKQTLYGDALLSALERLTPDLGRTDRDRLAHLATLAIDPSGIPLSACLAPAPNRRTASFTNVAGWNGPS